MAGWGRAGRGYWCSNRENSCVGIGDKVVGWAGVGWGGAGICCGELMRKVIGIGMEQLVV